nr:hypothetical protein [Tanacetum cinerariifolium]
MINGFGSYAKVNWPVLQQNGSRWVLQPWRSVCWGLKWVCLVVEMDVRLGAEVGAHMGAIADKMLNQARLEANVRMKGGATVVFLLKISEWLEARASHSQS